LFADEHGQPLTSEVIALAKKQYRSAIEAMLAEVAEHSDRQIRALLTIHVGTPSPDKRIMDEGPSFDELPPSQPAPLQLGMLAAWTGIGRARAEAKFQEAMARYRDELATWERRASEHRTRAKQAAVERYRLITSDEEHMLAALERAFQSVAWPRETTIDARIEDGGQQVLLSVDLPEIEDMPTQNKSVASRGLKLILKPIPETRRNALYSTHAHGVLFRLIGETFAALPLLQECVINAFTQRMDTATGNIRDQNVLSVCCDREQWRTINFTALESVDPFTALGAFEVRRQIARKGGFEPVEPLGIRPN
jgi:hypothetical protein